MNSKRLTLTILALSLLALMCTARAEKEEEHAVKHGDLPKRVMATINRLSQDAELTELTREVEHGRTVYEAAWKNRSGDEVEVTLTSRGRLLERERTVSTNRVPAEVLKSARKVAGKNTKLNFVRKLVVIYEAEYEHDGVEREIHIAPDGRFIARESEDEEDDDDESVSLEQCPKAVRAAVKKLSSHGEIEEIEKEQENGRAVYEVEIEVDDKLYEITIAPNGKILSKELEEEYEDEDAEDAVVD